MIEWVKALFDNSFFILFLVTILGYALGRIKVCGFDLGTAGVLIVALIFGHFNYQIDGIIRNIGLICFVTSVGFIAGPKFFRNFAKNATSYVTLGLIIIVSGALACLFFIKAVNVPKDICVGMLSGALTSTPGLAAAQEATSESAAIGYGIAYPFGVISVVLFVQIIPKLLHTDMAKERAQYQAASGVTLKSSARTLLDIDPMGFFAFGCAIVLGIVIAEVKIPLPGGLSFSLGTSGGPLLAGLIIGHFGHAGKINLKVKKNVLETMREFGLVLFLAGAGTQAGSGFVDTLVAQGPLLFLYGAVMALVPMLIGFFFAYKVLKLSTFNTLGSICGGMTSTPALGTLITVTGTDDVASAYAATYPVALVAIVLCSQFLGLFA